MRRILALAFAAALSPLCLSTAQAASISSTDSTYLQQSMQSQLGRYALASLAEKQASSNDVKALAKSIASDASRETQMLTALAKQYGVAPAKSPDVRASYHYSQLTDLHGKQFDQQFVQGLKIDDSMAVERHTSEAQSGQDPKLRALAKQRAQALQHEQQALDNIHA